MRSFSSLTSSGKPCSLEQTIQDLLPQAGQFNRVRSESRLVDESIWNEMRKWHADPPNFFDDGYVDKSEVHTAIRDVCLAYGAQNAVESVLTALYLKYRARFMNQEWNFHLYRGNFFTRYRDDFEGELVERVPGLGYQNCAALTGDIVDIREIDVMKVACKEGYLLSQAWPQLLEDANFSIGLIHYRRFFDLIENGLGNQLKPKKINEAKVIEDMTDWAGLHLKNRSNLLPLIAMAAHTLILRQV